MDNQIKKIKLDSKTLSSISSLITQKPKRVKNKNSKNKKQLQINPQNNTASNGAKIKKRTKKKNKVIQFKSQKGKDVTEISSVSKIKESKNKKQKQTKDSNNIENFIQGSNTTNTTYIQNIPPNIKKKKNKRKIKRLQNYTNNNNESQNTSKKRKKKSNKAQSKVSSENASVATNNQNSENHQQTKSKPKKNTNKLKRLQNKPAFKLDQQEKKSDIKINLSAIPNIAQLEKQVKKDLLNIKCNKTLSNINLKSNESSSLREKMLNRLKSSRFRYLNERLYTTEGCEAKQFFQSDIESFEAYHEGFRQQVAKWPMNPLDKIIASVKKMPTDHIIADFGCGEAKLARSIPHRVYSFDLVETIPGVIACDMAHCKLPADTVDVAVYCLSLMGTNLRDYLKEANRVLKIGGILKIAEVESRFDKIENFVQGVQKFGFKLTWNDLSHNLFYFLDFKKEKNINNKNKLPTLSLNPCMYKKR